MKTEPNVPYYTNLAKERVCFSLVKVSGAKDLFTIPCFYTLKLLKHQRRLLCAHLQMKSTHDAIDACSEAHQRDPRNANILRDRAEAYILNQEYEKGEEPITDPQTCSHDAAAVAFQLWRTTKRRWTLTTSRRSKKVWSERRSC